MTFTIMTAYPDSHSFAEAQKLNADFIEKGPRIEGLIAKIIETKRSSEKERIISLHSNDKLKFESLELASELDAARQRMKLLSKTQHLVIQMKKEGKSFKEMAQALDIDEGTARTHLSRALQKIKLPDLYKYL